MAKSDRPTAESPTGNAANAAQALFVSTPAFAPQSRHFWQAQDHVLQEVERFSSAWFKRRHDATRAALEVASQWGTNGMKEPYTLMKAMADWQAHSLERLAEDAKGFTEMMHRCAGDFLTHELEAVVETAENTTRAATSRHATPV